MPFPVRTLGSLTSLLVSIPGLGLVPAAHSVQEIPEHTIVDAETNPADEEFISCMPTAEEVPRGTVRRFLWATMCSTPYRSIKETCREYLSRDDEDAETAQREFVYGETGSLTTPLQELHATLVRSKDAQNTAFIEKVLLDLQSRDYVNVHRVGIEVLSPQATPADREAFVNYRFQEEKKKDLDTMSWRDGWLELVKEFERKWLAKMATLAKGPEVKAAAQRTMQSSNLEISAGDYFNAQWKDAAYDDQFRLNYDLNVTSRNVTYRIRTMEMRAIEAERKARHVPESQRRAALLEARKEWSAARDNLGPLRDSFAPVRQGVSEQATELTPEGTLPQELARRWPSAVRQMRHISLRWENQISAVEEATSLIVQAEKEFTEHIRKLDAELDRMPQL